MIFETFYVERLKPLHRLTQAIKQYTMRWDRCISIQLIALINRSI
jgi:hypothetical protein